MAYTPGHNPSLIQARTGAQAVTEAETIGDAAYKFAHWLLFSQLSYTTQAQLLRDRTVHSRLGSSQSNICQDSVTDMALVQSMERMLHLWLLLLE